MIDLPRLFPQDLVHTTRCGVAGQHECVRLTSRHKAGPACRPDLGHFSVPRFGVELGEDRAFPDLRHISAAVVAVGR